MISRINRAYLILFSVLSLGVLPSCQKDIPAPGHGRDGKVTLHCGASGVGLTTKGGPDDGISSIHAYVFDANGFLVEHAEAEDIQSGQGTDGDEVSFTVSLTGTSEFRRIHFVANITAASVPFGSESRIIGEMTTTEGNCAYWQYADLPSGIDDNDTAPAALRRLPMIRNCAAVDVENHDANFELKGFKIVNIATSGTVAPWTTEGQPFDGYRSQSAPTYDALDAAGYSGTLPSGIQPGESTDWGTQTRYVYEYPYTGNASTYSYVLLRGRLAGREQDSYYKMDIVKKLPDGANEYMNILRNIRYTIIINSMGSTGYTTPEEAASHPAGNNVSGSVDTESLDNISDGLGQLFVSSTDMIFVDSEAATLRFKFVPDVRNAPTVTSNGNVTVYAPAGDVLASQASASQTDDVNGWRTLTLNPKSPDNIVYEQRIRLSTPSGLVKTVRLRLRPRYKMTVSVTPETVESFIGAPVRIDVSLVEGLPESVFPLDMQVASSANSIYPDSEKNNIAVANGDGKYWFTYPLDYQEYISGSGAFTLWFKTNTASSATEVTVSNRYFETGRDSFANPEIWVTSFTIPARGLTVTGISGFLGRNSVNLYYDEARTDPVNNTTYRFYSYGVQNATTVSVRSMRTTDRIYFYNTTTRTTASLTIEEIESGNGQLAF